MVRDPVAAARVSHGLLSNPSIGLMVTGRCWGVVIGSVDKSDVCLLYSPYKVGTTSLGWGPAVSSLDRLMAAEKYVYYRI